ncbi:MAG: single-stranded DNA-binding protein [Acidobacteriaceae bacterium]|nr:single-stranded DNA-binding protein [Acidobacteriaceae bacterium]
MPAVPLFALQSPPSERGLSAQPIFVYQNRLKFHIKNSVNLIGFLGKEAEVKAAQDNSTNFTVLSLATKESWKNKQTNEWKSRTEWHRILVFGKLGDFAATLTKGAHIEVEGTLRSREQTLELKGSSKKNPETKNVRSWFVRAESIRKLDRAEKAGEDAGVDDVPC